MIELRTVWNLKAVPGRPGLDLTLTVDTTAVAVVEAIEAAAQRSGIYLTRVYQAGQLELSNEGLE